MLFRSNLNSRTSPTHSNYIYKYLSQQIVVGSLIRKYSELKIAEMFVQKCWDRYGGEFSSCNKANYLQGAKNTKLKWCGNCPKCANSYLLFAPFVDPDQLNKVIGSDMLGEFMQAKIKKTGSKPKSFILTQKAFPHLSDKQIDDYHEIYLKNIKKNKT